jgi:hypothetical protein
MGTNSGSGRLMRLNLGSKLYMTVHPNIIQSTADNRNLTVNL